MDLLHKTAVITGGGTGIGRSIARFLAAGGARVVLCGRREEILEDAKRDIESRGGRALSTTINVTDSESVRDAFEIIDADYGGTDILVNGAGVLHSGNIVDFSEQDWDATVEVNLKGVFLCSKYALPQILSRDSGVIINISSALARAPYPGLTVPPKQAWSLLRVYPGFPTLFWGLSVFFVGDLMGKALWKLVENAARFPRRGGRVLCVHGAVSFHRARPCGPRWLPGRGAMRHVELDRRVLGLQSTDE